MAYHGKWTLPAGAVALLLLAGCAKEGEQREVVEPADPRPAASTLAGSTTGGAPAVTAAESRYLTEALRRGMGQIELAVAVGRRSEAAAVDELTQAITQTHNEINAQLAAIATRTSVTLPNDARQSQQETIARMEKLSGRTLNKAYLDWVLEHYPQLVALHGTAAATASDMGLKEQAVKAQAMLNRDLLQARAAYAQVTGNEPPPMPEPGSPQPASKQ